MISVLLSSSNNELWEFFGLFISQGTNLIGWRSCFKLCLFAALCSQWIVGFLSAFSHFILSAFLCFPISSSYFSCVQYRYQDEDSPPLEHNFPRLTNEVRAPELVHVSEKNLSEIENVHGYVSHSHISPLKVSHPFSDHPMSNMTPLFTLVSFSSSLFSFVCVCRSGCFFMSV